MILTLTGTNDFAIKQALDTVVERFVNKFGVHGLERVNGENLDPTRLAELLQGASLFAAQRLVVLRDAAKNKPLWDALADWLGKIPSETTLIVVEPTLDKRTKTYKQLQKHSDFKVINELSERELLAWLQKTVKELGGECDVKTASYLLQQVGADQWQLWQELQKLVSFNATVTKGAVDELVEPTPQASAFELLDAALAHKPQDVNQLLARLAVTEDPYRLFGLLVSQVYALAVVKSAGIKPADTVAKEAGLHPFVVRKTQSLARQTSAEQLQKIIDTVALCDDQLKSTGVDPWMLLANCVQKIAKQQ